MRALPVLFAGLFPLCATVPAEAQEREAAREPAIIYGWPIHRPVKPPPRPPRPAPPPPAPAPRPTGR